MKRVLLGILLAPLLLVGNGCTGPSHMRKARDANLDATRIRPDKGKAALVVMNAANGGIVSEFHTYLDKKMIGVTKGSTFFIKRDVEPGSHYVIAKAETFHTGKMLFQMGRTYFIHHNPRIAWLRAETSMLPLDLDTTVAVMNDDCRLFEYDPTDPGEDLSDEDFKRITTAYEKDVNVGHHMEYATYRGYEMK